MKPLHNNVLIAELKQDKTTESGIILAGEAKERSQQALVMAVGPEVTQVKLHDKVIPDWSKGRVTKIGELQGVVIKEEDILCIIEE
jgi:chaperonin GroES